jgi:hypothetical protein
MNCCDVDSLRPQLIGEVFGNSGDAYVAQRGDGPTRAMNRETPDIDDAAPTVLDQVRGESARRPQVTDDLDVDVVERLSIDDLRELGGRRDTAGQRGVVYENVDAAELGDRRCDELIDRLLAPGISDGRRNPTLRFAR